MNDEKTAHGECPAASSGNTPQAARFSQRLRRLRGMYRASRREMMQRMPGLMGSIRARYATTPVMVLSGLLFLASQISIARILHGGNATATLLTLQTTFCAEAFADVLASLDPDQLAALLGHFTLDFLHPLWYGAFALLITARLFESIGVDRRWNALLWAAPVMAVLDILENLVHLPMIAGSLEVSALPVAFAAACATAKWLLAAGFVLLNTGLIFRLLARRNTS